MSPAILLLAAVLAPPITRNPPPTIELIATGNIPTATALDRRRIGGLSGLAFHDGRWIAVTDDKEDEPRVYELALHLDASARSVDVTILAVAMLNAPTHSDAEAVALSPDSLFVAFERPCAIGAFPFPSPLPSTLTLRRAYTTPEPVASRFRKNRAFESVLVRTADGAPEVWAFTESATHADGPEASAAAGAISRAVVWRADAPDRSRQHAYVSLPSPPNTLALIPSYNSLADAVAIDASHFLTLERSFSVATGYDAAIRRVTLQTDETDISALPSIHPPTHDLVPLHVETIATLRTLGAPSTVNYEAIALGPPIRDERAGRWLIILADDNFAADGQPSNLILAMRFADASSSDASPSSPPRDAR